MTVEQKISYGDDKDPEPIIIKKGEIHKETLGLIDEVEGNEIEALYFLDVITECDQFGEAAIYFENPFTGARQPKFVHPDIPKHTYEIISPEGKKGTATWTYILEKGVSYGLYPAPEVKGKLTK